MAEKITALGSSELILGFMGDQLVHRDNARAQLNDLVIAHRRNNKKAQVTCILAIEPWTDTLSELADWTLTSGFKLGLAGHAEAFENKEIRTLMGDAAGNIYKFPEDVLTGIGLVQVLTVWRFDCRLIVIADPNDLTQDNVYAAVAAAHGKDIPVKSLLHGMDMVILEDEDKPQEQETVPMRVVEDPPEDGVEDEDLEEEEYDDEELEDSEEEDSEEEEGPDAEDYDDAELEEPEPEEDEDDEVAEAELVDDESEGEEEEEPEPEVEDEVETDDEDAVEEDSDQSEEVEDEESEPEADEENDDEEEEEMPPVQAKTKKPTEASLTALAAKDRDAFYALAAKYKITPGRGIKVPNMVARILEATGGKAPAPKKAAAAPAKKAPAKKVVAAKKAPVKKASPAAAVAKKKAAPAPVKKVATTKKVIATKPAPVSSNGTAPRVSKATAKAFVTAATKALELAQELL